tara:strand:+ start:903 stop:1139 length:237 start_codon:yes stop_codon:yes gene_type:complete
MKIISNLVIGSIKDKVDLHCSYTLAIMLADGHGYSVRGSEELNSYDFYEVDEEGTTWRLREGDEDLSPHVVKLVEQAT